mgnify:CR=1 FL=1
MRKVRNQRHCIKATEERLGVPDIHLIDKIEQFVLSHDIWEGMDLDKKNYAKVIFYLSRRTQNKRTLCERKRTLSFSKYL